MDNKSKLKALRFAALAASVALSGTVLQASPTPEIKLRAIDEVIWKPIPKTKRNGKRKRDPNRWR